MMQRTKLRRRQPRRNATRKPILFQRDAHIRDYHREIDMILCADPEDWTESEAALVEARFRPSARNDDWQTGA